MTRMYGYELWNGKKSLGIYWSSSPLMGRAIEVPTFSILKEKYREKYEVIRAPIGCRLILDEGIDCTMRRFIDVRKKSKRQIEILKGNK